MINDILDHVSVQYGTDPDYPWAKTPEYAVLRHRNSKKWYGLLMKIPRRYIGLSGDGIIEVINVKCTASVREILIGEGRAYPAYHMNKEHWITLPLDGSLETDTVKKLIDESYELTR